MKKTLNISDQIINYHLTYKRIKNLYVKMDDNFNIIVSAPTSMSIKRIEDFLIEVYPRLLKRQRRKTKSKEIPVNETSIKILGVYEDKQKDINEQLTDALNNYLEHHYAYFCNLLGVKKIPSIRLVRVKSYLGQYNKKKHQVSLNILITHLDRELIDYILIHELAHTKYLNHQKEFWDFVAKYCYNYKELRKRAKKEFVYYENN